MTTQELKNALIEKNHEADKVERVTDKIENLSPDIREALENWAKTDVFESPVYGGYDVKAIRKAQPTMTVLGAYLALDWLRRDPATAKMAIVRTKYVIRNR